MLGAIMITFFSDMHTSAGCRMHVRRVTSVIVFGFKYCTVKFPIISFVVIILIIMNVIVVGFVLVSGTIIVSQFQ